MPKTKAPDTTLEEPKYLQHLADEGIQVAIELTTGEVLKGVIEFFDHSFIRLNRVDAPNLFVYKRDIKFLSEIPANA